MILTRRNFSCLGALAVAATGCQTIAAHSPSEQADIAKSVEMLRMAMLDADEQALMGLMAPELSFGHSNGIVQTRNEFVQSIVTEQEVFKSLVLTEHRYSVVGKTAIARHGFGADLVINGSNLSVQLGELQVWDKKPLGWQLLARQAFKV